MAALVSSVSPAGLAARLASRRTQPAVRSWALRTRSSAAGDRGGGGGGEERERRRLVLYSKPGCCLCDSLKEKLNAALSLTGGSAALHSVELQVRDITENPEWERRFQYEIPVLAKLLPDGTEETLPRLSPRLGVELIQKKIAAAFDN